MAADNVRHDRACAPPSGRAPRRTGTTRVGGVVVKASERAVRFPLPIPLRYRSIGDTQWRHGRIENISRTGLLFSTGDLLDVRTRIEMRFVLPAGTVSPAVLCRGHVVRSVEPSGPKASPQCAATISAYRFLRRGGLDSNSGKRLAKKP
jgi:PilZ domain-containing protein